MQKFYYEATHNQSCEDDTFTFLFVSEKKLKKGNCIVVDLMSYAGIVTAFIVKEVEPLDALTSRQKVFKPLSTIDLTEYYKAKEAETRKELLLSDMMDCMKDAKNLETIRKYAPHDENLKTMLQNFDKLSHQEKYSPDEVEEELS